MKHRLILASLLLVLSTESACAVDPVLAPMVVAFELLMSGIKADAAQDGVSAGQIGAVMKSAHESDATAITQGHVNMASEQNQWRFQYGTGQGWMPDLLAGGRADATQATKDADALWVKMTDNDRDWFRSPHDATYRTADSMGAHRYIYCSADEAAAYPGWCHQDAGGYVAGDSNAGVFMLNRSFGQEETLSGLDYADLVAPPPTVPDKSKGDVGAALRWANAQHVGAMNGAARVAMQRVIAEGAGGSISQANSGPGSASCPAMLTSSGSSGGGGTAGGGSPFGG